MKIAIAIYDNEISNVFDFARKLLLVEVDEGQELSREDVALESQRVMQRVGQLQRLEVEVLICGAISRVLEDTIAAAGIKVLPYIAGDVDDVLSAYVKGNLNDVQFSMPICRGGGRAGGRGRGGRGCGRGRQHRGGRNF